MDRDTLPNGAARESREADRTGEGDSGDTIVMEDGDQLVRRPEAPVRIDGACPFECCTYGAWTTTGPTTVYEEPDETVASRNVPAGTEMEATSGHVLITRVGLAVARDTLRLYRDDGSSLLAATGDTLLVLDDVGEGYRRVWRAGAIYLTDAASGLNVAPGPSAAELLVEPERQWWTRVRTADGATGWLWMDRTPRMEGADACS
ncbi:MAG TPA: hypothetical protein VFH11_07625 [Gemmatimonadota bacterium]|nr:hypothetical protein [Gemmatimonadota bacterium]